MFEQIAAMKALWASAPASYHGDRIAFDDLYCRPAPSVVPCWVGVKATQENCQAIARCADGWIPIEQDPRVFAEGVAALRDAFRAEGRDPAALSVRAMVDHKFDADGHPDLKATLASIPEMLAAGATHIEILPLYFVQQATQLADFFATLVATRQRIVAAAGEGDNDRQ